MKNTIKYKPKGTGSFTLYLGNVKFEEGVNKLTEAEVAAVEKHPQLDFYMKEGYLTEVEDKPNKEDEKPKKANRRTRQKRISETNPLGAEMV